jgi:methylthioribose-1-phosphate isomerase
VQPLAWDGARLRALDQTRLPHDEAWLELDDAAAVAAAIRRLAIRGAPVIGVAAAYGLAMDVAAQPGLGALERAAGTLRSARPTAANLGWAVDRVRAATSAAGPSAMAAAARAEAERIDAANSAATETIARAGAEALGSARRVLTHCNTGPLACGGRGTALGAIDELAQRHGGVTVLACEARPLLQGARLTVWELGRLGIAHELLADAAAPGLIARGDVDAVITGMDRAAANGDVANKVGTYGLALAAQAAGVPFLVAGPCSSIDAGTPGGAGIVIEERDGEEVRTAAGALLTVAGTPCRNPAFDVTPAALISALVTERGVARPVSAETVAGLGA